jgi:hypothetical protein
LDLKTSGVNKTKYAPFERLIIQIQLENWNFLVLKLGISADENIFNLIFDQKII